MLDKSVLKFSHTKDTKGLAFSLWAMPRQANLTMNTEKNMEQK